jgi:hypothetical protein
MGSHGSVLAGFHVLLIVLPPLTALAHRRMSATAGSYPDLLLRHLLFIGVGLQGTMAGLKQIFAGQDVAAYTNWAYSPFVAELGLMNLSYGILGLIAPFASRGWQYAAALGYGIFLLGAAVGHVADMAQSGNVSLGNAGPTLWSDFLIPVALLALVLWNRREQRRDSLPAAAPRA